MISFAGYGIGASALFGLIAVVSLLGFAKPAVIRAAALRPYTLVRNAEYWRLISSGFVHASLGHLILNLLTFFFFAFALERTIGTPAFLGLYFLGLLLSGLSTCYLHRNDPNFITLGASGAVCAVLFAAIVYFPTSHLYILPLPFPIPAPLFAVIYLGYSYYRSRRPGDRINHDAHIAGALAGLAFVAVTDPAAYGHLIALLAS